MDNNKPAWMIEAEKYIGLKEIKGSTHEQEILKFWKDIHLGGVKDDETPWCAAYVGACLEQVGIKSTRSGWAKSYLDWGVKLERPAYGCVVVFDRNGGGGHSCFAHSMDKQGRLMCIGGNQKDMVSIAPFDIEKRIPLGYFWPKGFEIPMIALDISDNDQESSTNEA